MTYNSLQPGVYSITHRQSKRQYIGSSLNVKNRFSQHRYFLGRGNHFCKHLQNAWNKYGEDQFDFLLIEECSISALLQREQHYLDATQDLYNTCKIAGSTSGYKHTEEAKLRMSRLQKRIQNHPQRKMANRLAYRQRQQGSCNPNANLSEDIVRSIRYLLSRGVTCTKIAKTIGVSISTISGIKTGQTWKHVV